MPERLSGPALFTTRKSPLVPPPPGASPIPGLEISGQVAALGEGVTSVLPGQQVCALVSGGGYGEYCLAVADHCLAVPAGLSLAEAAALGEGYAEVGRARWRHR